VQSAVQIKSDKNKFTCNQCADKERFKIRPKQSLAYTVLEQLHYLLVVVIVSDIYYGNYSISQVCTVDSTQHSRAVLFAVN